MESIDDKSSLDKDDSTPIVYVYSSNVSALSNSSGSSKSHHQQQNQQQHQHNDALKDLISLEKIVEIDEADSESRPSMSRPSTRQPLQRSQATFRASSVRDPKDINTDSENEDDYYMNREKSNPVLITELGENFYNEGDSSFESDEEEIVKPKKKVLNHFLFENNIENENEYDTDLEDQKEEHEDEHAPKYVYKKMCENLKVTPCSYFMAHIDKQKIIMRYHQFSDDEIRAIAKPLWNNIQVEKLYLDGNYIECNGAKYLSRMIRQNDFITELSLADNRLGETSQGSYEVCRMISENCILKKLNLSGNLFSDKDIEILTNALEKNRLLKELDLSHNRFGDDGGKFLGQYISSNDTLESLDLSWNNFRKKASKEIAIGIKENVRLKRCNVSFNGFDADGGKVLADVIKNNSTLEHLDISNTRLNAECAGQIANALLHNETLKSLNISNNPLTTSGAFAVIYGIRLNSSSTLEFLDLSEIPITKDFEVIVKEIQETKGEFKCKRGAMISSNNTKSISYESGSKVDFEKIINSLKNK